MKLKSLLKMVSASALLSVSAYASSTTTTTTNDNGDTVVTVITKEGNVTTTVVTTTDAIGNQTISTKTVTDEEIVEISRGFLTLPDYVSRNTTPDVSWDVVEDVTLNQLIDTSVKEIKVKQAINVKVTVLGTGVTRTSTTTTGSGKKKKTVTTLSSVPTTGKMQVGNQAWATVHTGNEDYVVLNKITYETTAEPGDSFKFQAWYEGGTVRTHNDDEVLTLVNGDSIPTNKASHEAVASAEDFLKPYLNVDNTLKLGSLDFVYVAELTHNTSQKNDSGYDLQDLIILVSVSPVYSR
ncbi:hypothetical protein ACFPK9_11930 [Rubritalea spongiae]|uniref:Uncharacterized protein n=1 Tax=Rubritalea spongiae TaxID=430797 RepID=A0ABW5E052_9BACT